METEIADVIVRDVAPAQAYQKSQPVSDGQHGKWRIIVFREGGGENARIGSIFTACLCPPKARENACKTFLGAGINKSKFLKILKVKYAELNVVDQRIFPGSFASLSTLSN